MKNLKKTLKKFRKVRLSLSMKIISLLSCIALVSMGFASWWIIKVETGTTMGSFKTYEVEKKNVKIDNFTAVTDGKHPDIVFGKPENYTPSATAWLRPMDKDAQNKHDEENLSFTYTFDLSARDEKTSNFMDVKTIVDQFTLTLTPSNVANFKSAISKNYITSPTISYKIGSNDGTGTLNYDSTSGLTTLVIDVDGNNAITVTNNAVTFEVTIEFDWGTEFGSQNPYTHFNALQATDENVNAAYTKLGELNTLMGAMTYEITYDITLK